MKKPQIRWILGCSAFQHRICKLLERWDNQKWWLATDNTLNHNYITNFLKPHLQNFTPNTWLTYTRNVLLNISSETHKLKRWTVKIFFFLSESPLISRICPIGVAKILTLWWDFKIMHHILKECPKSWHLEKVKLKNKFGVCSAQILLPQLKNAHIGGDTSK